MSEPDDLPVEVSGGRSVLRTTRPAILAFLFSARLADIALIADRTGLAQQALLTELNDMERIGYVRLEHELRGKIVCIIAHLTDVGEAVFLTYLKDVTMMADRTAW